MQLHICSIKSNSTNTVSFFADMHFYNLFCRDNKYTQKESKLSLWENRHSAIQVYRHREVLAYRIFRGKIPWKMSHTVLLKLKNNLHGAIRLFSHEIDIFQEQERLHQRNGHCHVLLKYH